MKTKKKIIIITVLILVFAALVFAAITFFPLLQVHHAESAENLYWQLLTEEDDFVGQNYFLSIRCASDDRMIRNVHLSPGDHTLNITIDTCGVPRFGLYHPEPSKIELDNSARVDPLRKVTLNDDIVILENSVLINPFTAELFALQTPYVGDISQDEAILKKLWLGDGEPSGLTGVTYELKTSEPPYEWTINFGSDFSLFYWPTEEDRLFQQKRDACVLLALIGNLDAVVWNTEVRGKTETLRFDTADAKEMLGKDVKSFGESAAGLQALLEQVQYVPAANTLYFTHLND